MKFQDIISRNLVRLFGRPQEWQTRNANDFSRLIDRCFSLPELDRYREILQLSAADYSDATYNAQYKVILERENLLLDAQLRIAVHRLTTDELCDRILSAADREELVLINIYRLMHYDWYTLAQHELFGSFAKERKAELAQQPLKLD